MKKETGITTWRCEGCVRACEVTVLHDTNKPIRCPFDNKADGESLAQWRVK